VAGAINTKVGKNGVKCRPQACIQPEVKRSNDGLWLDGRGVSLCVDTAAIFIVKNILRIELCFTVKCSCRMSCCVFRGPVDMRDVESGGHSNQTSFNSLEMPREVTLTTRPFLHSLRTPYHEFLTSSSISTPINCC